MDAQYIKKEVIERKLVASLLKEGTLTALLTEDDLNEIIRALDYFAGNPEDSDLLVYLNKLREAVFKQ